MVVREVMDTERSFLASLDAAHAVYYPALAGAGPAGDDTARRIFQLADWNTIRTFSMVLVRHLSDRLYDKDGALSWDEARTTVGDVFLFLLPYYKVYTRYVSKFEDSRTFLRKIATSSRAISDALARAEQDQRVRRLNLASFLIMPVQRVPQTLTLLVELLKQTPRDHPDHSLITRALAGLQDIYSFINTRSHQTEEHVRLVTLASQLSTLERLSPGVAPLIQPHRRLLREFDGTVGVGIYLGAGRGTKGGPGMGWARDQDPRTFFLSLLLSGEPVPVSGELGLHTLHVLVLTDVVVITAARKRFLHSHEDPRKYSVKLDVPFNTLAVCHRTPAEPETQHPGVAALGARGPTVCLWMRDRGSGGIVLVCVQGEEGDVGAIADAVEDYATTIN